MAPRTKAPAKAKAPAATKAAPATKRKAANGVDASEDKVAKNKPKTTTKAAKASPKKAQNKVAKKPRTTAKAPKQTGGDEPLKGNKGAAGARGKAWTPPTRIQPARAAKLKKVAEVAIGPYVAYVAVGGGGRGKTQNSQQKSELPTTTSTVTSTRRGRGKAQKLQQTSEPAVKPVAVSVPASASASSRTTESAATNGVKRKRATTANKANKVTKTKENTAVNGTKAKATKATTTKATTTKATTTKAATKAPTKTTKKRAASEDILTEQEPDQDQDEIDTRPKKKAKTTTAKAEKPVAEKAEKVEKAKKAPAAPRAKAAKPIINERATVPLNVFTFGTGEMGELGQGPASNARIIHRPRLNPLLPIDTVGVVNVAVGGMHAAAIAKDGTVLTWGVNDHGALGRDTKWSAPEKSIDSEDKDDSDIESEVGEINPKESSPGAVQGLPEDVNIVQISCSDNLTAALTDTGFVYAWGTFRCAEGILGFSEDQHMAEKPVLLPNLKNIVQISAGTDHILALTNKGSIFAWGNGQQYQLGRRIIERTRHNGLVPRELRIPRHKIKSISAGSYHSFAITQEGKVFAWGLNQFRQCGITDSKSEEEEAISHPMLVKSLSQYNIVQIGGGEHHSIALTDDGKVIAWGRNDQLQLGMTFEELGLPDDNIVYDDNGKQKGVNIPIVLTKLPRVASIGTSSHHSIAICEDGTAYSWGDNLGSQNGMGPKAEDMTTIAQVMNTAVQDQKLTWAGCGGQFSVMAGVPKNSEANGVNGA